jgi:quercetin dioxygenase-like cupin family protein
VIEPIVFDGQSLGFIVRGGSTPDRTTYLTPSDCPLQLGYVVYSAGQEIPRHVHLPIQRRLVGTAEVLIVERGRCEVDIYTEDRRVAAIRELRAGDILIATAGGHGFRILEDTVLLEIKQGPYPGDGADKERF